MNADPDLRNASVRATRVPAPAAPERLRRATGSRVCLLPLVLLLAATAAAQTSAPPAAPAADDADRARLIRLGSRGFRVHDPSTIVKCGDTCWMFCTGRGVSSFRSKDLSNWESGPPVFTNAPGWVASAVPGNRWMHYWAPDVIESKRGYLLYYSVSTFGRNTSAIGLATNPTLDPADPQFRWTDQGIVIQSTNHEDFNAIDPGVSRDAAGKLWMTFGSFWSGIKMIQLDAETGKRIAPDSTVYSLAYHESIEAPAIYYHAPFYYLFVNWGICCRGTNSTYEIRVGRSKTITGPYLDKAGKDLLLDGGSEFLQTDGALIGPGHAGIFKENGKFWLGFHFYDRTQNGRSTFALRPLHWGAAGWPELPDPGAPAKP